MAQRILYLDGIRAVAILFVLLEHAKYSLPFSKELNKVYFFLINAELGVRMFFVLSGFLITHLLFKEYEKRGKISLKNFYINRSLRILPVFYTYLIVVGILVLVKVISIRADMFVFAGTYIMNYARLFDTYLYSKDYWYLAHFWTLALEEQFYLIWPFILIFAGLKRVHYFLIGLLFLYPVSRLIVQMFFQDIAYLNSRMLFTGADAMFYGCLGAYASYKYKEKVIDVALMIKERFRYIPVIFLVFLFVVSPMLGFVLGGYYSNVLRLSLESCVIIMMILYLINSNDSYFNVLNSKPFQFVGVISYSLYIWQQLILTEKTEIFLNVFPLNIVCCFVMAILSYYFIEKPVLKFKRTA